MLKELQSSSIESKHPLHYRGFFECFNRQMHYEAHDVLEDLWLKKKGAPEYLFYKGLIQLAGAFVHLKKNKLNPGARLLRLAQKNLEAYAPVYEDLEVQEILGRIQTWLSELEGSDYTKNIYDPMNPPRLDLKA